MKIKEVKSKTILTKSGLPGVDYCINPYIGCFHGCVYCYARFMKRFTNHPEKWGEFVDVKINAPEVLEKELLKNPKRGGIFLGSVTDAYQPVEKKYELTREILKVLLNYEFPVSILTKSGLITRDIDLLKQFKKLEAGFSISTLNKEIKENFEPCSPLVKQRIEALKKLHDSGVKTYAFISPVLPELTKLKPIFKILQGKIDYIMAESLNIRFDNWEYIQNLVKNKYPHLLSFYQSKLNQEYWGKIEREVRKLSNTFKIPLKGFYRH